VPERMQRVSMDNFEPAGALNAAPVEEDWISLTMW